MSPIIETGGIAYVKYFWYIIWIWLFEYLNIPQEQLTILSILMSIDLLTWILKQKRIDKSNITSYWIWQGVIKKILTIVLLLSIALMCKDLSLNTGTLLKRAFSTLIVAETYSITQNIYIYRTWKKCKRIWCNKFCYKQNLRNFIWIA